MMIHEDLLLSAQTLLVDSGSTSTSKRDAL